MVGPRRRSRATHEHSIGNDFLEPRRRFEYADQFGTVLAPDGLRFQPGDT